jgi:hypothetical protein
VEEPRLPARLRGGWRGQVGVVTPVRASRLDAAQDGRAAILAAVREGIILAETARRLARSLGLTVRAFRAGLRELLEREQIAVTAEPRGQLTIRSKRRRPMAALPGGERW